jgi:Zn ribbon nucleic-acid-binding protein
MTTKTCPICEGKGYWLVWGNDGKEIKDCWNCLGSGFGEEPK